MSQLAVSAGIIQNSAVGYFPQKQKDQRHLQFVLSLFFKTVIPQSFFFILESFPNLIVRDEFVATMIETGMAGKSSWDQADRREKLGLVWRNRKKISQIIKDYLY